MSQLGMPDNPFTGLECSGEGDGCACTATLKPQTSTTSGTFSTSGNTLTITESTGDSSSSDYCVSGSTLRYKPSDSGMSMMGFSFMATVVLTR
jgi:hypothetical protein